METIEQHIDTSRVSLFEPLMFANWNGASQNTIYPGDIRHPWASAYGFPMVVAQLAAHQKLVLHCREDEVFEMMAELNELLKQPAVLNQAYKMLRKLEKVTLQKLANLIQIEDETISAAEISELVDMAEQLLTKPTPSETVTSRIENILSPNQPTAEVGGLRRMLARLQAWLPALESAKEQGFQVVVQDRQRQPARPALAARKNEVIWQETGRDDLKAGFLFPVKHHLTLWAYLVCRSDQGQSLIWN